MTRRLDRAADDLRHGQGAGSGHGDRTGPGFWRNRAGDRATGARHEHASARRRGTGTTDRTCQRAAGRNRAPRGRRWPLGSRTHSRQGAPSPLPICPQWTAMRSALPSYRGPWSVVAESSAGSPLPAPLAPGEAARIFTGAPVPAGADTILIQEEAARDGDQLMLSGEGPGRHGKHIRPRGNDFGDRCHSDSKPARCLPRRV